MKYRLIKLFLNKIYEFFLGVHNEIIRNNYVSRMSSFGTGSYFEIPVCSMMGLGKISIGNNTYLCRNARLDVYSADRADVTGIRIGNNCYIGYNFSVLCGLEVVIEDSVLIASDVTIIGSNHGINPESEDEYMHQELDLGRIVIGEGTWIGEKVMILPDVSIGKKCVLGSGSVITKSVPDYCIAAGNPAKVIKKYNSVLKEWEKCK